MENIFFKIFLATILTGCFFCSGITKDSQAQTDLGGFVIEDYRVEIDLQKNGDFLVEENILVNFSEPRHGIFRKIPYKYKNDQGLQHNYIYEVESVKDENGKKYNYKKYNENGYLVIKIGDANRYVENENYYIITYKVRRGFRYFDDHSELFWNAIGTEWNTSIEKAETIINLPRDIKLNQDDLICYTGFLGSTDQNCTEKIISENQINFSTNLPLQNYQGLTLAVKFPVGYIEKPTFSQEVGYFLADNWGFLLPVLAFILMFWLFKKYGQEIDLNKTIIAQYDLPKGMTPGEAGFLMKEYYSNKFVSADLVDLAVKGYLKIKELPKKTFQKQDYELIKLKNWQGDNLKTHQKKILGGIFSRETDGQVKLSELKTFYNDVNEARKEIKKEIEKQSYFEKSIFNNKILYFVLSPIIGFLIIILAVNFQRWDILAGGIIAEIIVIIFSFFMSKKTRQGAETLWHIKGLREYVKTAEKYRVKFQEEENLFEKFLPYAMVFGLADKWAKAFEGIIKTPPSWYESSDPNFVFVPTIFASFMDNFSSQTVSHSAPPSSSSSGFSGGGGSSGGGGGGGGGGSW